MARELPCGALLPDDPGYHAFLGSLFTTEASEKFPTCIVQPSTEEDVQIAVRIAHEERAAVTTRGGGLSTVCTGTGAVVIDLRTNMGGGTLHAREAQLRGGGTMGELLDVLAPAERIVPIGVVGLPGLGLATQGGFGHLTRSYGLTLDHIEELEFVTAEGKPVLLNADSSGDLEDLWWAVRGAAPTLGIATAVKFRSQPDPSPLRVHRMLTSRGKFPAFMEWASQLPHEVSASAVLAIPAGSHDPMLFTYFVCPGADEDLLGFVRELEELGSPSPWSHQDNFAYGAMPAFDPPAVAEVETAEVPKLRTAGRCPLLRNPDPDTAARVAELTAKAPTPLCRIDFQHAGGIVKRVPPDAMAFHGREADWNCPIVGVWPADSPDGSACEDWVEKVWQAMEPCIVGVYSTEIRPGLPGTEREVALAFGENLARLQRVKQSWDPDNVFRCSFPLGRAQ